MNSWQDFLTLGLAVLAAVFVAWRMWRTARGRPGIGCATCDRCPGWQAPCARPPDADEKQLPLL